MSVSPQHRRELPESSLKPQTCDKQALGPPDISQPSVLQAAHSKGRVLGGSLCTAFGGFTPSQAIPTVSQPSALQTQTRSSLHGSLNMHTALRSHCRASLRYWRQVTHSSSRFLAKALLAIGPLRLFQA